MRSLRFRFRPLFLLGEFPAATPNSQDIQLPIHTHIHTTFEPPPGAEGRGLAVQPRPPAWQSHELPSSLLYIVIHYHQVFPEVGGGGGGGGGRETRNSRTLQLRECWNPKTLQVRERWNSRTLQLRECWSSTLVQALRHHTFLP